MVGLVFVSLDLQAAWNSWWECSLLGGNPQGPGVRSKNASSRRFSSAISSVSGKNHFLTVGLGYPISASPPPPPPPRGPAGASGAARRVWSGQRKPGRTGAGPCSRSPQPRPAAPGGGTSAPLLGKLRPRAGSAASQVLFSHGGLTGFHSPPA